jgi:multiple sugar transport system substrate-binding protein
MIASYATAPIDEAFNTFVLPTMFAKAARDEMTVEAAVRAGDTELRRIFDQWK